MLKNRFVKFMVWLIGLTIVINLILGLISTFLPVAFLKPEGLIDAPRVFYNLKLGGLSLPINQTLVNTWVLMVLIILILYFGTRKLSVDNPGAVQLIFEDFYRFIAEYFLGNFKEYKKKFVPFFSAMFSLILFSNLSLFLFPFVFMTERSGNQILVKPFFRTATADINTTVGLALIVFVLFIACAIKREGVLGFFKELAEPFVFMLPLNIIGELAKPLNISMRLFGNMFAGLVMIALMYGISFNNVLAGWTNNLMSGSFSFAVIWPGILQLYLDLFVGILQAFIFTVLSSVYVEQALIGYSNED